ncbi:hypothetical protein PISL3812_03993 [Talaromyces islandicus]|uniref:Carcinoembryonic antigen-related cell adhesion molecule 1 n=1 Tax=Talaromyces islandicus TaxID=28573 RepID=A0A0U1LWN4_TALIS|nr:hypothetical protein PISL3812_03993 [Talaromyces islandicus]
MRDVFRLSWRRYALGLVLPPMATAMLPPIPAATIRSHGNMLPKGPQPTASFDDNEFHAAVRRQASDSPSVPISLSTSFGPASLCGWIDGEAGNDVYCNNDEKCVFHAPNTAFGGMGGCCPNNDDIQCGFESICYDAAAISATPAILSSSDPFAMYCTDTSSAYCVTWFYTQLGISDYGCGTESSFDTVFTDASYTPTVTGADPIVMKVSVSYVPDDLLSTYADLLSTASTVSSDLGKATTSVVPSSTTTTTGPASTSAANTLPPTTSGAPPSGSSTPVGAIVGGAVGGVVGLGAIAGACFMFWLWMRKKRESSSVEMSTQSTNAPGGGYQSVPQYQHQSQGWDNSTVSEAGGSEIKKGPAEFYTPPPAPVEIGSDAVAELPASNPPSHR